jgi:hypothetical protein
VTSVNVAVPAELNSAGGPITTSGTITLTWVNETANRVFAGPTTGVPAVPTFRALVAADIPALSYVSSVALAAPTAEFTVSGSPVTSTGTLTFVWKTQNANIVFAGPSTGAAATPTFRSLVAADIPALAYVTSIAIAAPSEITVAGSPITTSGTITLTWTNESANKVFAGPSTGSPATPTFRSLVAADLPAGTGTVTSVALTAPTEITVAGSPVTTTGTLALTWATQNNNLFFCGPNSGGPSTPAFRTIKAEDIGTGTPTTGYATLSTGAGNRPAWGPLTAPAIGYTTGLDKDLPAANAYTFFKASDTRQLYTSDNTNRTNVNGNNIATTMGIPVGGFDASNYMATAQGATNGPTLANAYTLCLMFYVVSLPGTGGGTIMTFHPGSSLTAGWLFSNSTTNSNKFHLFMVGVAGSAFMELTGTSAITTGPHAFCFNYNGSNVRYCLDGGAVSTIAAGGTYTVPTSASQCWIGRFGGSGAVNNFADFGFAIGYNSALSDGDMQTLSAAFATYRPGVISATHDYYFHSSWGGPGGYGVGARAIPAYGPGASAFASFFPQGTTGIFVTQR